MPHDHLPDTNIDWKMVERYVTGETTPGEADTVEQRLASDPLLAALVDQMSTGGNVSFDVDRNLTALQERIRDDAQSIEGNSVVGMSGAVARSGRFNGLSFDLKQRGTAVHVVGGFACVAALAVGLVMSNARRNMPVAIDPSQEYSTPRGGRATVRLTDGTRVMLGPSSRLRYGRSFGTADRVVWIDGDAYLDVAQSSTTPFRVIAGRSLIQVLGTSFVVRAREDSMAQVVVESGAVSFRRALRASNGVQSGIYSDSAPAVTLIAGDLGRIGANGRTVVTHHVDVAEYRGWTTGRVVFRGAPLSTVIQELERWYDVDIGVTDRSALVEPVTMTFSGVSVDAALERLSGALDMRYSRTGRSVRLTP